MGADRAEDAAIGTVDTVRLAHSLRARTHPSSQRCSFFGGNWPTTSAFFCAVASCVYSGMSPRGACGVLRGAREESRAPPEQRRVHLEVRRVHPEERQVHPEARRVDREVRSVSPDERRVPLDERRVSTDERRTPRQAPSCPELYTARYFGKHPSLIGRYRG